MLEIDIEILRHKRKAKSLEEMAREQNKIFKDAVSKANDPSASANTAQYWREYANYENKKLIKLRKSISSIFEMQIPRLVRTRAAMQTIPMSFMDPKEGVVMQNER